MKCHVRSITSRRNLKNSSRWVSSSRVCIVSKDEEAAWVVIYEAGVGGHRRPFLWIQFEIWVIKVSDPEGNYFSQEWLKPHWAQVQLVRNLFTFFFSLISDDLNNYYAEKNRERFCRYFVLKPYERRKMRVNQRWMEFIEAPADYITRPAETREKNEWRNYLISILRVLYLFK